jgi:hypothetical protein
MFLPRRYPFPSIVLLILSSLILYACSSQVAEPTATIPPSATSELSTPTIHPPTRETLPPTPILTQSLVVFVAPPEADSAASEEIATTLSELAAAEGLDFEIRPSFSKDDLSAEIKIIAALSPETGLADLAGSAPAIQFLGVLIPGLEPAANITVIEDQGIRESDIGFLAGFLAAVVSPEWRVGTISTSDSPGGLDHRRGFLNGAVFFCGLCQQILPPFLDYPLFSEAPAGSTPSEWRAAADILIASAVDTVYVAPGAGDNTLYEYLANAEINLIGIGPPPPGLEENWIGTISGDFQSAVRAAWPGLLTEQAGTTHIVRVTITNINPDLFSPGRQHLVEKMITELSAGFIDTGVGTGVSSP